MSFSQDPGAPPPASNGSAHHQPNFRLVVTDPGVYPTWPVHAFREEQLKLWPALRDQPVWVQLAAMFAAEAMVLRRMGLPPADVVHGLFVAFDSALAQLAPPGDGTTWAASFAGMAEQAIADMAARDQQLARTEPMSAGSPISPAQA